MPEKKKHLISAFVTCFVVSALAAPIAPAVAAISASDGPRLGSAAPALVAQDDDVPGDENDVAPQDVDKYIKVYQAMQHDRNLTVEQATAQQGISVSQFRSMEDRIERNDALREHVREALKPKASPTPAR